MIVQGDRSSANGYLTVVDPGRKAVLFDIDGTLTLNDFEAVGDYLGISNAQMHNGADELVWSYVEKGYQVVFLTARQYWLARTTREWFNRNGLIHWHLRTDPNADNPVDPDSVAHKTGVIRQLRGEAGLNIIRAYGNSDTDLESYEAGGIPSEQTYIIGELAGEDGTQPIHGDYMHHLSTVVANTPDAGCTWR